MGVRGPQPSPNARRNGAKVYISPAHAEKLDKIRESQSRADWLEQTIDTLWEKRTMANTANGNNGYGYIVNGVTAPQVYAINGGYATAIAYIQAGGQAGTFSAIDEWEWEDRILPTVAECESEIMATA
jgi:hypothetical protein